MQTVNAVSFSIFVRYTQIKSNEVIKLQWNNLLSAGFELCLNTL